MQAGVGVGGRGGAAGSRGDGLIDRQREVLVEGWKKQENQFTSFPFMGATLGPTRPSSGVSALAAFR